MPCECDEKYIRSYYKYYDTPDGCDVPKKALVTARYGAFVGVILSTYDVLMYSHANGLIPILKRYMMHTIPLSLMGATFALVANGVHHSRQRDDALNYFAGGLACGPIVGAYLGSKHAVLLGGIVLGVMGMIKKDAIDKNYMLFPEVQPHKNNVWRWRFDNTLSKDPLDEAIHICGLKKK